MISLPVSQASGVRMCYHGIVRTKHTDFFIERGIPMAAYTIEDIELIRRKSGISYQEAVALLDYHNGNVARALVDLERNGRLKENISQEAPKSKQQGFSATVNGKPVTKSTVMELLH